MKRSRARFNWKLPTFILALFLIGYFGYRQFRAVEEPVSIFEIGSAFEYGDTSLTGVIRQSSSFEEDGTFILSLADSRPVLLDVGGLENLVGTSVLVTGFLNPPDGEIPMTMQVSSIETL